MYTVEIVCLTSEMLKLGVIYLLLSAGRRVFPIFASIPSLPPTQSWLPALPSTDLPLLVPILQWLKALPLSAWLLSWFE